MSTAVKIRLQLSKWFSKAKTKEEVEELKAIILYETNEALDDRMFELNGEGSNEN